MKKLLAVLLALAMTFAMCACGDEPEEQPSAGIANPVTECTYDELVEATGLDIAAPEGAEDVAYSYISGEDFETIAQVVFTFEGKTYCYRAQSTGATSIMDNVDVDEDAYATDLEAALKDGTNIGAALSGMNYEWECSAAVDVEVADDSQSSREGICAWNDGKEGFITWLDVVPGILYSLSMDSDCTQDALMTMANSIFQPMQGDA